MNRKIQSAALALLVPGAAAGALAADGSPVRVAEVLCDGRHDPVGVDPESVRFSWVMESDARGQSQGAYRVEVASRREDLLAGRADVWVSGRVGDRESLLVRYAGPSLAPARAY
jgi:alpha-L-rhamnosidase